ncbi:MAG: sortase [Anaerolineales bacterium]|nr:sortase [Anaerolineales bacterium]
MAKDKKHFDDYSIEELEEALARRKLDAHASRLQRFRKSGRVLTLGREDHMGDEASSIETVEQGVKERFDYNRLFRRAFNRLLLWVEIVVVFGMVFVFFKGFGVWQTLNREVAEAVALPTATQTPLITAVVLPSGHTSPNSPGGAQPNNAEIPENLQPIVQSMPQLPIPTPGPQHARQIFIEKLWNNPQPVVEGDGWEQLKKGVGHHIGSANPGESGNLVLSAHNDIFGELFRNLDRLKPGDLIVVSTGVQDYEYVVTGLTIVEPTEVSVMDPTEEPTVTLISCYPYLIDNQRIVVFGELTEIN